MSDTSAAPVASIPAAVPSAAVPAPSRPAVSRRAGGVRGLVLGVAVVAAAALALHPGQMAARSASRSASRSAPRTDVGTEKATASGRYRVLLAPERTPVPLQQLHRWMIRVSLPDGRDALVRQIEVDGGMPEHGHGLPTQPRVTGRLPDGRFVVDGMKFSMPGWWELRLRVSGPAGVDSATYNLSL